MLRTHPKLLSLLIKHWVLQKMLLLPPSLPRHPDKVGNMLSMFCTPHCYSAGSGAQSQSILSSLLTLPGRSRLLAPSAKSPKGVPRFLLAEQILAHVWMLPTF